jgi:sigma-E factor negative regulatory protein RseC
MAGTSERGLVIAVDGDSADVRVSAGVGCEGCKGDCCRVDKDGVVVEAALNEPGARVGDEVEVVIPEGTDVRAGLVVYVLPVVALLLGYLAGNLIGTAAGVNADAAGAIGAVLMVSAGLLLLRVRGRSALREARFRPRVRAIIAPGLSPFPDPRKGIEHDPLDAGGKVRDTQ